MLFCKFQAPSPNVFEAIDRQFTQDVVEVCRLYKMKIDEFEQKKAYIESASDQSTSETYGWFKWFNQLFSSEEFDYAEVAEQIQEKLSGIKIQLLKNFPTIVHAQVAASEKLKIEIIESEADFLREVFELQSQFQAKRQEIKEQSDIINIKMHGSTPWIEIFKNADKIKSFITANDEEALKHLTAVRGFSNAKVFQIEFIFAPNPFFENSVLVKSYLTNASLEIYKSIGCEITWKDGKNLIESTLRKDAISFFDLFNPPVFKDESTLDEKENIVVS